MYDSRLPPSCSAISSNTSSGCDPEWFAISSDMLLCCPLAEDNLIVHRGQKNVNTQILRGHVKEFNRRNMQKSIQKSGSTCWKHCNTEKILDNLKIKFKKSVCRMAQTQSTSDFQALSKKNLKKFSTKFDIVWLKRSNTNGFKCQKKI